MASLSKEMRSKRDIKRTSSLLIVDKDMGNMGLYRSILSMEYETDYAFSLEEAQKKTEEKDEKTLYFGGSHICHIKPLGSGFNCRLIQYPQRQRRRRKAWKRLVSALPCNLRHD